MSYISIYNPISQLAGAKIYKKTFPRKLQEKHSDSLVGRWLFPLRFPNLLGRSLGPQFSSERTVHPARWTGPRFWPYQCASDALVMQQVLAHGARSLDLGSPCSLQNGWCGWSGGGGGCQASRGPLSKSSSSPTHISALGPLQDHESNLKTCGSAAQIRNPGNSSWIPPLFGVLGFGAGVKQTSLFLFLVFEFILVCERGFGMENKDPVSTCLNMIFTVFTLRKWMNGSKKKNGSFNPWGKECGRMGHWHCIDLGEKRRCEPG